MVEFKGNHTLYVLISDYLFRATKFDNHLFSAFHISAWRHWGCVTPKILDNVKKSIGEAAEIDGYEELNDEDKARVVTAWEEGHVADADIPDTAKKPEGEEAEKPKKKATKKASKKKDEDAEEEDEGDEEEEVEEKPNKRAAKKATKKADVDEDGEGEVGAEKPKKARATKKV
jgi:hypothetical protein